MGGVTKNCLEKIGQSIYYDVKARRLKWAGHVARSNPLGSFYTKINATINGMVRDGRWKDISWETKTLNEQ